MDPNEYHFITTWRVEGTAGEVADVVRDPLDLVRWWPAVYLSAEELAPEDLNGVGRRIRLCTKGWLPYTLNWECVVVENRYPNRFALEVSGAVAGRAAWTIEQDGAAVNITHDWRVTARTPLLRTLAPIARWGLESNHRWAMRQGEESLRLELARRRAATPVSRAAVPPPPGPVTYAAVGLVAGAAVVGGTLAVLIARQRRRARRRRAQ